MKWKIRRNLIFQTSFCIFSEKKMLVLKNETFECLLIAAQNNGDKNQLRQSKN